MDKKVERIVSLYNRVVDGEVQVKADEAARYGVNERSIQRDIDDIRAYFANDPESNRELIYDRTKAEAYGNGVDIRLRGQGDIIEIIYGGKK